MESDELSHTVSQIFFGYPYMQCLKTSISYLICIYRAFVNIMFKQFCKLSHFNSFLLLKRTLQDFDNLIYAEIL